MGLCDPIEFRGAMAPSRVLFGPHVTNLASKRSYSDAHVEYYQRRAIGGAGIIVTETASVDATDWPYERAPLASASNGLAAIVEACHAHGALVVASLGHCGSQGSSTYSQLPLLAPSRVPDVATHDVPVEIDEREIAALIEAFSEAARGAIVQGADGVELDAGARSLIRQFCSGLTNQRTDRYGTNRSALLEAVVDAVREVVGDKVVGLRFSADELAPWAGITPETAPAVIEPVLGLLDYVVVTRGAIFSEAQTTPAMAEAPGFNRALIEAMMVASSGRVAVIGQGSIIDVAMGEDFIERGVCDGVEMTRAQIADPDLVQKHREGRTDQIRPCILCNQRCRVLDVRNPIVSCTVNPSAGHERGDNDLAPFDGVSHGGRMAEIVGAGPAGLEVARCLAERGFNVTVTEREDHIGGALALGARAPGRERLATLLSWYEAELGRLGVDVITGTVVDTSDHTASVLAIGGTDRTFVVRDGNDGSVPVMSAAAVLGSGVRTVGPAPVCVVDPIGGPIGVSIAALLGQSVPIVFVSPDLVVGTQLSMSGELVAANALLAGIGASVMVHSELVALTSGNVVIEDRFTGEQTTVASSLVIDCGHRLPLGTRDDETAIVCGDAIAPRSLYEAVLEGRRAAAHVVAGR